MVEKRDFPTFKAVPVFIMKLRQSLCLNVYTKQHKLCLITSAGSNRPSKPRAQRHGDLRDVGPYRIGLRGAESGDGKGRKGVHHGGRGPGDPWHPGAGAVPDRDPGPDFRTERALLVLPEEVADTAVFP